MTTLAHLLLVLAGGAQSGAAIRPDESAFLELESAYKAALQLHDQARLDAGRGRGAPPERHPAEAYWPRMNAAAEAGSPRARQWLLDHVALGVTDTARRLAVVEAQIQALFACCADGLELQSAVAALQSQRAVFGEDAVRRNLERILDEARNAEVRARALMATAPPLVRGDAASAARIRAVRESVVLAFPATKAAREAANAVYVEVERELSAACAAWLDAAAAVIAAGRPPADWPPHPYHDFATRIAPLAAAGAHDAKSWAEVVYPAFRQSEKLAPDLHLSLVAREITRIHLPRDAVWGAIRLRTLALAARVGGAQASWLRAALAAVAADAPLLEPLSPLVFTDVVLELPTSGEVRAQALWIDAQTRIQSGLEVQLARALESLDALVAQHPDQAGLAEKAAAEARGLRAVMPGAPLPDSRTAEWGLRDVDNLEVVLSGYRGRVLLLEVFDPEQLPYEPLVAERAALAAELAGRPFLLVGLSTAAATLDAARRRLGEIGVTWRCGLLQSRTHPYLRTLYALRGPSTLLLVDAEGVIRARNRPFAELAQMARELTAAAEAARPGK